MRDGELRSIGAIELDLGAEEAAGIAERGFMKVNVLDADAFPNGCFAQAAISGTQPLPEPKSTKRYSGGYVLRLRTIPRKTHHRVGI